MVIGVPLPPNFLEKRKKKIVQNTGADFDKKFFHVISQLITERMHYLN